jgi:F0F1-type ATP synthase delta subunit
MTKISPQNIAQAIYKATEGKSGQDLAVTIKHSAQLLTDKQLLPKSGEVLRVLQNIFDRKTGTVRAKVITARGLSSEKQTRIKNEIKEQYKAKAVEGEFFENKELLGGMRVEVGDEVLDNTYRNKLGKLEKFLMREE